MSVNCIYCTHTHFFPPFCVETRLNLTKTKASKDAELRFSPGHVKGPVHPNAKIVDDYYYIIGVMGTLFLAMMMS